MSRRFWMLGGLVAVATAAALATVSFPAPHTGGDNAAYLSLAHALVSGEGYTELWDPTLAPHTKYPPVFPATLGALMLMGATSWAAFKLLSAIGVAGAVLLAFAWAAGRAGPLAGAAVASLTVLSGGWLQASRWILSEPVFLVLTFLALWATERAGPRTEARPHTMDRSGSPAGTGTEGTRPVADADRRGSDRNGRGWLVVAGAAAALAFFTRSAGLPLVLAFAGALVLARRIRAAAVFGICFSVPAAWWVLRARRGGEGAYQSEFWMVNPYQPELGEIGWLDLPARVWANLEIYVGAVLPGEWWPGATGVVAVGLGILLVALAAWGWFERIRRRRATAELFVPLYAGLILLWPEVWSGDRFILPLYPLALLYGGEMLVRLLRPLGRTSASAAAVAVFLVLALPTLPRWLDLGTQAQACRRIADAGDPVQCHGAGFQELRYAAAWAGANLPDGSIVLNRKPRVHYALGGPAGRTFPFTRDPDLFLSEADRLGARYLLLDHVDGVSLFYLPAVIRARPGAFCHVIGWGGGDGRPGTDLFGIRPPELRTGGADPARIGPCPDSYLAGPEVPVPAYGARVPRLVME